MTDAQIQEQKEISFEEFYKSYQEDLFYYAQAHTEMSTEDTEDILGEAFLLLFQSWERIEQKTPLLLIVWMRKTIRYLNYNQNRKKHRFSIVSLDDVQNLQTQFFDMKENAYAELLACIQRHLTADEYRLFMEIVIFQKSFSLIAKELNMKTDTLYVRWFRLRKKIQSFL